MPAGGLVLIRDPATGLLTDTALGVVTPHYDYDAFGELEAMSASVSGTPIFTTDYVRDKLGRITAKTEMIEGVTKIYVYGYDAAGRLDTVTIDGVLSADYDYDANGNRLQKWTPGGTETGTYDDQDRLQTYAGASYGYTRNGELQTKTDGVGTTTYDYDVFGNLLGVDLPDGTEIDYVIDARNRRIGRKEGGAWTQKLLWQSHLAPVAELDAGNAVVSRFVTATRVNVPDYMIRGGQTYRILTDHLGSPRLVANTLTGAAAARVDYDEYGVTLLDTNPSWVPIHFGGGLHDPSAGLVRFGARDLETAQGRWLLKDPIQLRGRSVNFYRYSSGDPVNLVDPDGRAVQNRCRCTIFVKPEEGPGAIPVLPGRDYTGAQDGVAVPNRPGEVFKSVNGVDVEIGVGGSASTTASGPVAWGLQVLTGGWKGEDWLDDLHGQEPPGTGWDDLFDSVTPPQDERPVIPDC